MTNQSEDAQRPASDTMPGVAVASAPGPVAAGDGYRVSRMALLRFALPAAIFVVGCTLTVSLTWGVRNYLQERLQTRFENQVDIIAENIERRFAQVEIGLGGARGLVVAREGLRRREFEAYSASRQLDREFPGVRGFGFIERVPRHELDAFLQRERADDAPDFGLKTSGAADDLYVIKLIEPLARNRAARGLDVGAEAVRREAVERAVRTGSFALTGAIRLVQDGLSRPGFLYMAPVYRRGQPLGTPQQRLAALRGLVYAPIVLEELMQPGSDNLRHSGVDFAIQEMGPDKRSETLFSLSADAEAGASSVAPRQPELSEQRPLLIGGRLFFLKAHSTPQLEMLADSNLLTILLFGGIGLSSLLAWIVWLLASARHRAQRMAEAMTEDLQRLARVARHTSDAVIITDAQGYITWANEGFTRISGYSLQESMGRKPGELLQCPQTSAETIAGISRHLRAEEPCRIEMLNRHKDGHDYWVDLEIQPLRDDTGRLTGFMAVERDITERLHREKTLQRALHENEQLMRAIDEYAIVSIADRQGAIIDVNAAFERISGYSRDELVGQNHRMLKSGEQDANLWPLVWATISEGKMWRGEVCNRAKDGQLYWVDSLIMPFVDEQGLVERYVSIRTDITSIKRYADVLARERERLANILRGTNVGTWEWCVPTGEVVLNERWAQIVGYTLDELAPVDIETRIRLSHPDELERSRELLRKHFSGESDYYEFETRMRHKDGHWVWVLDCGQIASRRPDGKPLWVAGTLMDISRRKQAEAALRESQAFLERAGRVAGIGAWRADLQQRVLYWSDQTCRIYDVALGYQPTMAQAYEFFAPQERATINELAERCIATGSAFDVELPLVTASGRSIWVRAVGEVERHEGRVVALVGALQDITQRHQMEEDLRRNNELLQAIIENIPGGLSVVDEQLNMPIYNSQFVSLLEFPPELMAQRPLPFESIIRFNAERGEYGPDGEKALRLVMERARHPTAHQFRRERPNGAMLEVRGAPLPGGGFVTIYTDVTQEHRSKQELEEYKRILHSAMEALDEAFVIYDQEDRLLYCNEKYRRLYEKSADLIVPGARFEDIIRGGAERGQYPEAVGRIEAWVAERMALHQQDRQIAVQRLESGRWLRIVEARTPDGYHVGFRIDVTELKQAVDAAESAAKAKGQFLANMSHEIRTPMNAILGMLQLLQGTALNLRQQDYVNKTQGAARSLLGLLNDILDYSKVEAGKMTLDPHPFQLDQLLRELSVILSANVGRKPLEVLFDIDPAVPRGLIGDALRLKQVLINLAGNAIKFTEQGEVVLSLRVESTRSDGVQLRFAVRDSGIGIAAEHQARIFDGFTQAESSTTRRFGGTGLGLAICQRLVALMGGRLELRSEVGQGSTFAFSLQLPLDTAHGDVAARTFRRASPWLDRSAAGQPRVLVVDDNALARQTLAAMGTSMGWEVDPAANGEEALHLLHQHTDDGRGYQACFVDWRMPGMDGWELCRRIRELTADRKPAPLLIMVSANGQAMLLERSAEEQKLIDGFVVKPVTASILLDAIVDAASGAEPALASVPLAQSQRLAGLRLLLVEDNPVNQQVARELLNAQGAEVQVAGNGRDGVDAVAAALAQGCLFDAVLMDLQMPVMDGLTATGLIRGELGLTELPIIAMTANALASDREVSLAAGMNDHIGKPFELDHLVQTLLRQTGRLSAQTETTVPPAADGTAASTSLAPLLDRGTALQRLGGNQSLLDQLTRSVAAELPALPEAWGQELTEHKTADATRRMHTLKSTAATIGAMRLAEQARLAEKACQDGSASGAKEAWQQRLRLMIEDTLATLHSAGVLADVSTAAPADRAKAAREGLSPVQRELLSSMLGLLRQSDLGALEIMDAFRREVADQIDRWGELDRAISSMDFARAAQLCEQALEQS